MEAQRTATNVHLVDIGYATFEHIIKVIPTSTFTYPGTNPRLISLLLVVHGIRKGGLGPGAMKI